MLMITFVVFEQCVLTAYYIQDLLSINIKILLHLIIGIILTILYITLNSKILQNCYLGSKVMCTFPENFWNALDNWSRRRWKKFFQQGLKSKKQASHERTVGILKSAINSTVMNRCFLTYEVKYTKCNGFWLKHV